MTRSRADDTSALPAAAREPDGHTHPMPRYVSVSLVVFALAQLLTFGALRWEAQVRASQLADEARNRAVAIAEELDRRTAARDAESAETKDALCRILTIDLAGSPNAADLAEQYNCP